MTIRILATHKGDTGYLYALTGLDLRTRYGITLSENDAATFPDRRRAERMLARVRDRFEHVELEEQLDIIDQLD